MNALLFASMVIISVNAQYAVQQPSTDYAPIYFQQRDNYVCTIQANYALFGQHRHPHRPIVSYCQDSYKQDACDKCCKIAARIQGTSIKQESIIGFNIVLKKQPHCICCSPTNAY